MKEVIREFDLYGCDYCGNLIGPTDWVVIVWSAEYPLEVRVFHTWHGLNYPEHAGEVAMWLRDREAYLISYPPNWSSYSANKRSKRRRFAAFWRGVLMVLMVPLGLLLHWREDQRL